MDLHKKVNANPSLNLNWATLPTHILDEIMDKLVLGDCIRFAAVCTKWRLTFLGDPNYRGNQEIPMVMLPHWLDDNEAEFYSVIDEKTLDILLPVSYPKRFIGSSFGWLISVDTNFAITLLDPFSRSKNGKTSIQLPPVINSNLMSQDGNFDFHKLSQRVFNHEYYFVKAILSIDPAFHPDDYVVMLIYGKSRRLAFIRPSDKKGWVHFSDPSLSGFCDIMYSSISKSNVKPKHSSGFFYALQSSGVVYQINIEAEDTRIDCFAPSPEFESPYNCEVRYVVESSFGGELLQVVRLMEPFRGTNLTCSFKVFKLVENDYWVELKSLGSDVLFVGDGSSLSAMLKAESTATESPTGCQRGSVYFLPPFRRELLMEAKPFKVREGPNDNRFFFYDLPWKIIILFFMFLQLLLVMQNLLSIHLMFMVNCQNMYVVSDWELFP